jgi:hypothetical protein
MMACIMLGTAMVAGSPVGVRFQASPMTPKDCQECVAKIPRAVHESWGRNIVFNSVQCKPARFK